MSFSYGYGHQQISNKNKCRRIAGNFGCHTDAAVRRVQGFTRSHWMPPLDECLHRIAPATVTVNEFVETTLNTTKTQLILAER